MTIEWTGRWLGASQLGYSGRAEERPRLRRGLKLSGGLQVCARVALGQLNGFVILTQLNDQLGRFSLVWFSLVKFIQRIIDGQLSPSSS